MRYARAQDILPAELVKQLQEYIDGTYLYVPRKEENRLAWGDKTQSKQATQARNCAIFEDAQAGKTVSELAETYFLAEKTIRHILSEERKKSE